jgi:O-antigen/teichoic acid export membrane protein
MFKQLVITYKETFIYSLGNLSNKIVGFILLPLYTSYISIHDFGVLGLIEPLTQLIFTSLSLGLNSAFMRWYAVEKDDQEKGKIFFNTNLVLFINTFVWVLILIMLAKSVSLLLFSNNEFTLILKIAFANVFFLVVNPIIFSTLRIQHKPIQFSFIRASQFTLNLFLNIYFIVYLEWGLLSIFLSQLISQVFIFIYFLPFYFKLVTLEVKPKLIKEFFVFSLPLMPVGILNLIIIMINRYFLEYYDTLESVGIFSFAFRISNTIKVLVIESLTLSLTPILYQKLAEKTGKRFIQKNFIYASFIIIIVYMFIASFSREFILLIAQNKDYYSAYLLIPILGFAYVFHTVNYFYYVVLSYAKRTIKTLQATLITAIITVILNIILVPYFKIYGAAAINVLSTFILFVLLYIFSKSVWGVYFEINKLVKMILLSLIIVLINNIVFSEVSVASIIIKLLICLSFPVLLYPIKFYERIEIEKISQLFSSFSKIFRNR